MKTTVGFFFGGNSVEHEVSIISCVQAMQNTNKEKYNIIPIYIAKNKKMYYSEHFFNIENFKNISELLKKAVPVFLTIENNSVVIKAQKDSVFKKFKPIALDVAFPVVHGTNCEDGSLQGYFELLGIPYVGCDVLASALGMDKYMFKLALKEKNVPVLNCITFTSNEYTENSEKIIENIEKNIGYPLIIKPQNLGSSVGISKVENIDELKEAILLAQNFALNILAEKAVENLREINCSVVGYYDEFEASECEEPIMQDKILSYEDKYLSGGKNSKGAKTEGSKGMSSLSRKLPADITAEQKTLIQKYAVESFKAIGGHGVARIDFLINDKTKEIFVNEINTIPGSLAFYLWEASGIPYSELITKLIKLAFNRQRNKENLSFSINTNILNGNFGGLKK